MRKAIRAHGGLRHGHRGDAGGPIARRRRPVRTPPRRRAGGLRRPPGRCRSTKIRDLRYGENPHQRAAWYRDGLAGGDARRAWRGARCCRARSCRTRTCSISMRPRASCSSSTSRPRWSSSTRTRAAPRPAQSAADAYVRAREPTASRPSAASSALNRPIDAATAEAHRLDVHRGGDRAGGRRRRARRCWRASRTCAS